MCLQDATLAGQEDNFRQLYYMLSSIFHFKFHKIIESLKDSYAPLDPDSDTRPFDSAQTLSNLDFVELLGGLLDNNAGVFHRLANDAEEEECKEALLAYYFLLISDEPLTRIELDKTIEQWLQEKWQCSVDFEIGDALNKLRALKLLTETGNKLSVVSINEGIKTLDAC